MAIEIRPPAEEELRPAMEAAEAAFGGELEEDEWERDSKLLELSRALVALDSGRPVGLAAAFAFPLSIPGGELPCAGVTWVGVLPSHRRRGILTDFMRRQLSDFHAWGEPLAALWASETSIYGRFGYGLATQTLRARSVIPRFALRAEADTGLTVRLTDADDALALFPPLYDRFRAGRAGMIGRSEQWWKELRLADPKSWRRGASQKFYAVAERDGRPEGYATYRVKGEFDDGLPKGEVQAIEVIGTTTAAELALWQFLHRIDLAATVDVFSLDPATPLPLAVRDPRALGLRVFDALWLRLVDVDAALRARSYKPGESVVLEVRDDLCDWNAGRYRVGPDAGRTADTADLALDARDLASVYLGAFDFHRLARAGLVEERREGALEAATTLFRTDEPPYCPEVF